MRASADSTNPGAFRALVCGLTRRENAQPRGDSSKAWTTTIFCEAGN
jgi:hypothetical protein